MYQPSHFRIDDAETLQLTIEQSPFATLVTHGADSGLTADHLPLLFEPANDGATPATLLGHIARGNPLARELKNGSDTRSALAIFHGPHAYITPSWYPAKRDHGKVVPTWNYQVVHAHCRLRLIDDPEWLKRLVGRLTLRFERDRPSPWPIDDAPDDYIAGMCRAIMGIELTIERLEGKRKASQHKPISERESIYRGLQVEYGYPDDAARYLSGLD
ncbi:FMN-binding negative transcriptional regulator [Salinicola socius]|uniref:Transcriptional regulator n=1 Tax=Salinicola socius TaxID=404433 RepID=A0A1Q8STA8_9GAMM|nr:FMN-binding negative transcriptional regulator [Salinicola socius]OLO04689.1 transcriptional regulator [Salinicola socius]